MKNHILIFMTRIAILINKFVFKHDAGYRSHIGLTHHSLDYLTYKKAEKEWDDLEAKYGDWELAFDAEPNAVLRLEDLLA